MRPSKFELSVVGGPAGRVPMPTLPAGNMIRPPCWGEKAGQSSETKLSEVGYFELGKAAVDGGRPGRKDEQDLF